MYLLEFEFEKGQNHICITEKKKKKDSRRLNESFKTIKDTDGIN